MHFELVRTINLFWGNVESAQNLCDRQAAGRWRCEY
jgi:hypothetical protein